MNACIGPTFAFREIHSGMSDQEHKYTLDAVAEHAGYGKDACTFEYADGLLICRIATPGRANEVWPFVLPQSVAACSSPRSSTNNSLSLQNK